MGAKLRRRVDRAAIYAVLAMFAAFAAFPVVLVISTALKEPGDARRDPFSLFSSTHPENFANAWVEGRFGTYFLNTVLITGATVVIVIVMSVTAGYALARLDFPGRTWVFFAFVLGLMIPFFSIMIPLFFQLDAMGLLGSPLAVILPGVAGVQGFGLPLGVFLMRAFFLDLPVELSEAATDRRSVGIQRLSARDAAPRQVGRGGAGSARVLPVLELAAPAALVSDRTGQQDDGHRPVSLCQWTHDGDDAPRGRQHHHGRAGLGVLHRVPATVHQRRHLRRVEGVGGDGPDDGPFDAVVDRRQTGSGDRRKSGIGRAIAIGLATAGADVVVHYATNRAAAEQTAGAIRDIGRTAELVAADLAVAGAGRTLAEAVRDGHGPIDIVILNATAYHRGPFIGITDEDLAMQTQAGFRSMVENSCSRSCPRWRSGAGDAWSPSGACNRFARTLPPSCTRR